MFLPCVLATCIIAMDIYFVLQIWYLILITFLPKQKTKCIPVIILTICLEYFIIGSYNLGQVNKKCTRVSVYKHYCKFVVLLCFL